MEKTKKKKKTTSRKKKKAIESLVEEKLASLQTKAPEKVDKELSLLDLSNPKIDLETDALLIEGEEQEYFEKVVEKLQALRSQANTIKKQEAVVRKRILEIMDDKKRFVGERVILKVQAITKSSVKAPLVVSSFDKPSLQQLADQGAIKITKTALERILKGAGVDIEQFLEKNTINKLNISPKTQDIDLKI